MSAPQRVPAPIPLLLPDMPAPQALLPWLQRMHDAQQYSNFGPLVGEMETRLLDRFAARSPVPLALTSVSSATLGLELVLSALDLPPHSRVLIPSLTFVATATAVLRAGHVPVLADVDAHSWLLTPDIARRALLEAGADAVMPVAAFGAPHDSAAWHAFQQETGIPVVIDAAGAFGSQWLQGQGGTAVFSLHATKSLPAGEGGFVVSSDPAVVARVRQLSNFGINLDAGAAMPIGTLARIGTNAKLSEYHAAVCLASMTQWDARAALRRELYAQMGEELSQAGRGQLRWQAVQPAVAAPTLLCIRMPGAARRDRLERLCAAQDIGIRRWYQPLLGRMLTMASHCVCLPTPNASRIESEMCGLPFFPGMSAGQRARVVEVVRLAMD